MTMCSKGTTEETKLAIEKSRVREISMGRGKITDLGLIGNNVRDNGWQRAADGPGFGTLCEVDNIWQVAIAQSISSTSVRQQKAL